ncbi:AIPR protein [Pontibacter mucosus]|uniref:AIPR protein n=1 Tax=Pontibacter mucosus TaxID=1649266 RepID=A0A2T5YDZ3_9BACT|nr:AIPR family protein [Pontibacter mucosus]PTX14728.1 AIPR protein [Pontibacter mucosus]
MATNLEHLELNRFLQNIQQDIRSSQLAEEEGGTSEQLFTQTAVDLLADAGETENVRVSYDEKVLRTGVQHKINAYALSDNYETLDLFITVYKGTEECSKVFKEEIDRAAKRITNFFRNAVYKDYVNEIEESSEIFDLAHTLSDSQELREGLVRVNAFILTDGICTSDSLPGQTISGHPIYYRIVDINYLYNISEKSHVPIEINFKEDGFLVPCIYSPSENAEYQSYLAIISGEALVNIYERFGSRLLEQNVRSFLQFTGKINKGIRKTILTEPHMFLAFNNGLAATAEEIQLEPLPDGSGNAVAWVKDLQIVNGGQTTASIYHTWKKDKADVSGIFVQVKLNVVKNQENFSSVVARIAEYANTQNKISASDLSSNSENHILLEKLSRTTWAPPVAGKSQQTRWFYDRARGQYKTAMLKEGFTPAKRKAFELKNPKQQVLTKEDLAKYINTYQEVYDGKKLLIGPHYVVRGNQKNYIQFMHHNFGTKPDSIFFEDAVAKAILFRAAEKVYGVKPNAIGDMRYITVPYAIAWLGYQLNYRLDLYKIWKAQSISEKLRDKLREVMMCVETYIKANAPGSLYGEWAKKEDCWTAVRKQDFGVSLNSIAKDLEDKGTSYKRARISEDEMASAEKKALQDRLKSVHPKTWDKIEEWGKATGKLSQYQRNIARTIGMNFTRNRELSEIEFNNGQQILDLVIEEASEILFDTEEFFERDAAAVTEIPEISLKLIQAVVKWDKKNRKLRDFEYRFMADLATEKKALTDWHMALALRNYEKAKRFGFSEIFEEV